MYNFQNATIQKMFVHYIGNKLYDQGLNFSSNELEVNEEILSLLKIHFTNSFKIEQFFTFFHESDLNFNEVYSYVTKIFDNIDSLKEQSINLSKHLYEHSTHPKIKGGEFYVVVFKNCIYENESIDVVGLFKSEIKDTFFKVNQTSNGFEINSDKGVNINKLDKGCLIFNSERRNGYVVAVVDNTKKGAEAQYWVNDFLHVRQRKDEYYNTKNVLSLCQNFVSNELPHQFEVTKIDQIDLLNRSVKFLHDKENFELTDFTNEVIIQPEIIECFNKYKSEFQTDRDIEIADNFTISGTAVKKQSRLMKSVIKLDQNFHIYIHGNNQYIKKGFEEESGMSYYQLFYKEEQ